MESDLPSAGIALPTYLGIAISLLVGIAAAAVYVYRFRLSLNLENMRYGRILFRILTFRSKGYLIYRWETAKSEWASARKYHRQSMDEYLSEYKAEVLTKIQDAERRLDKALERLKSSRRRPK